MSEGGEGENAQPNDSNYSVRFSPRAERETAEAATWLAEIVGSDDLAVEWFLGIKAAAGTLATNPRRFPVHADASRKLGRQVRGLLFQRRSASTAAYHLYYSIEDNGDDGPTVRVVHVRHASRKPITRAEAKEIRAGQ
jgi:plasmid stabilization system protein ParE